MPSVLHPREGQPGQGDALIIDTDTLSAIVTLKALIMLTMPQVVKILLPIHPPMIASMVDNMKTTMVVVMMLSTVIILLSASCFKYKSR